MKSKSTKLKLTIELVPATSWCKNVRSILSKAKWREIREKTLTKYKNRCGICGAVKRKTTKWKLHCHEYWKYDDKRHIQKLVGFIALCSLCHFTKHMGFAGALIAEGYLGRNELIRHFMKVNNCKRKVFKEHVEKVFEEWSERSRHEWQIDFGKYKKLISGKNKQLQKKIENAENEWKPKTVEKILKTRLKCPKCKQGYLIIQGWKRKLNHSIHYKRRLISRKGEIYQFFECKCDRYPICKHRCGCALISGCGDMSIAMSMIRYKKRLVKLLDKLKI